MTARRGLGRTVAPPRFAAFLVLLPLAGWGGHAAFVSDTGVIAFTMNMPGGAG